MALAPWCVARVTFGDVCFSVLRRSVLRRSVRVEVADVSDPEVTASLDFEHLFARLDTPLAVLDPGDDFVVLAVNEAYCEATGRSKTSLVGHRVFDLFPGGTLGGEEAVRASFNEALRTGQAHVMALERYDIDDGDGNAMSTKFWSITNTPVLDPVSGRHLVVNHPEEVTSFIDARYARDRGGAPLPASTTRAVDTVFSARVERLHLLSSLSEALVGAATMNEVARALLRDSLGIVGAVAGSVIVEDGNHFVMLASDGIAADTTSSWSRFAFAPSQEPFSDAVAAGEPGFYSSRNELLAKYPAIEEYLEDNHHAWAVLPLRAGERTYGALGLIFTEAGRFDETLRLVLHTVASLASQAMSRAQLLSEQRVAIDSIGETLLTMDLDSVDGLDASGVYLPASQAVNAGGDWYDVVALDDARTLIVVGDIANHGPQAVGEMAHARSVTRAAALGVSQPEQITSIASAAIARFGSTHATATIAVFDRQTRQLEWTSAGHPPAVLVPVDDQAPLELLDAPHGPPLGVGTTYSASRRELIGGDRLVLYTDGLIERRSVDFDDALQRLIDSIDSDRSALSTTRLLDEFFPIRRHDDDVAVIIVEFT